MLRDLAKIDRDLNDLPSDSSSDTKRSRLERKQKQVIDSIGKINDGLDSPYLTILGYTTPVTFEELMGFEQATNGFLARAMIFTDLESNPKRKKFTPKENRRIGIKVETTSPFSSPSSEGMDSAICCCIESLSSEMGV